MDEYISVYLYDVIRHIPELKNDVRRLLEGYGVL